MCFNILFDFTYETIMTVANYSDFFLAVEFCSLGHLGYFSGGNRWGLLNSQHNVTSWTLFPVTCSVSDGTQYEFAWLYYPIL